MDDVRFRRPTRGMIGIMIGPRISGRLVFGLVVTALGVLWTLDNLGLMDASVVVQWWPTIVIAIGLAKLTGVGTRQHAVWGGTFTIAGLVMLANSVGLTRFGLEALWPVILILL